MTYSTRLGPAPFELSLRWVPTVAGRNRFSSTATFMATATPIF